MRIVSCCHFSGIVDMIYCHSWQWHLMWFNDLAQNVSNFYCDFACQWFSEVFSRFYVSSLLPQKLRITRSMLLQDVHLSVPLSVCHMLVFYRNGLIYHQTFSPSGSHTILAFPYQMAWQWSDGGVECKGYETITILSANIRDVRNRFFYLGSLLVWFFKKNWFGSEWVWFGSVQKTWFGLDIIVICYSCNSWVVNLQQIFQWQWMTWLWHHSQQRQQVNNIIAF